MPLIPSIAGEYYPLEHLSALRSRGRGRIAMPAITLSTYPATLFRYEQALPRRHQRQLARGRGAELVVRVRVGEHHLGRVAGTGEGCRFALDAQQQVRSSFVLARRRFSNTKCRWCTCRVLPSGALSPSLFPRERSRWRSEPDADVGRAAGAEHAHVDARDGDDEHDPVHDVTK